MEQLELFEREENDWREHYFNMPEYNNVKQPEPLIIAKFKFRTEEDYNYFHSIIKKYLYNGEKVFDGMQKIEEKQAWFPLPPRPSEFNYIDDEE